jgi:hypothetical protein
MRYPVNKRVVLRLAPLIHNPGAHPKKCPFFGALLTKVGIELARGFDDFRRELIEKMIINSHLPYTLTCRPFFFRVNPDALPKP